MEHAAPLLVELATQKDPDLARLGSHAIFSEVIETLGDAFDRALCDRYIAFFARVIEYCRRLAGAEWLDQRLSRFNLHGEEALVRRAVSLRQVRRFTGSPRKILVLSRVTLGADVAVTSVVLQKMMKTFPEAQLVLLCGERAALLFEGEARVRVNTIQYPRGGGLLERLAVWPMVLDAIEQESSSLPDRFIVVDPDSRLTQLGMLPVGPHDCGYYFFESRSYAKPGVDALSELTAAWLDEVFGPDAAPARPAVWLPTKAVEFSREIRKAVGGRRAPCVSINLGVGDNEAKRIEDPFEFRLLSELLNRGRRIFLDKGIGPEELERSERLLRELQGANHAVVEIEEGGNINTRGVANASVIAWRGSLAGFGAIIDQSDLYIGYDSACQHVAAALGVRVIDIFAGFRSPMIPRRWKPSGTAPVTVITVDPQGTPEIEKILDAVLEASR